MAVAAPTRTPERTRGRTPRRRPDRGDGGSGGNSWAVIVKNDAHNTFEHVNRTLCRYIPGMDPVKADGLAWKIHRSGQAVVWTGPRETCELYVEQLAGAGLTMLPPTQLS